MNSSSEGIPREAEVDSEIKALISKVVSREATEQERAKLRELYLVRAQLMTPRAIERFAERRKLSA